MRQCLLSTARAWEGKSRASKPTTENKLFVTAQPAVFVQSSEEIPASVCSKKLAKR